MATCPDDLPCAEGVRVRAGWPAQQHSSTASTALTELANRPAAIAASPPRSGRAAPCELDRPDRAALRRCRRTLDLQPAPSAAPQPRGFLAFPDSGGASPS